MTRAFTTDFNYLNKTYTAVISHIDGHLSIYIPDNSLHHLLPSGKASINTEQGLRIDTPRLTPEQDLLLSILCAVDLKNNNEPTPKRNLSGVMGK